jgi:hypothetical protein
VLKPDSAWTVSDDQGNAWSHRQAAWHDLYSYSTTSDAGATIEFRPTIGISGKYEIFEWHPDVGSACSSVPTEIYINGKLLTTTSINQSRNGGQWNSLESSTLQMARATLLN